MTISTPKTLSLITFLVVIMNALFHLFGMTSSAMPLGTSAVMTIFTSISVLCLASHFFLEKHLSIRKGLLLYGVLTQVLSLALLLSSYNVEVPFFQPSSLPTSLFLLIATIPSYIENVKELSLKFRSFWASFLMGLTILFVLSYITDAFFLLGISQHKFGVGLSLYSIITFILLTAAIKIEFSSFINLKNIKVEYHPLTFFYFSVLYVITSFSLTFMEKRAAILISFIIHPTFLLLLYQMVLKPFYKRSDRYLTICSWTNRIKDETGSWKHPEEVFESLGLNVTHGISEDQMEKVLAMREAKKKSTRRSRIKFP